MNRARRVALGALLGGGVVAGCGTRRIAAERPADLQPIKARLNLRVLWQGRVAAAAREVFTPAFEDGQVYAIGGDGAVSAHAVSDGRLLWRQPSGIKRASAGIGAGDGRVAAGGLDGEIAVLTREGKPAWQASISSEVLAAPVIDAGLVIARTTDGRIFGLEADSGRRRWVYQRPASPSLALRSHAALTVVRGAVFAGFPNGRLVGLDARTGAVGIDVAVALPRGATELERVVEVASAPAFEGSQVCAVAFQGRVACFDAKRGSLDWGRDISSSVGLDMDARAVYVVDDVGAVHALDRAGGASLWRQAALRLRSVGAPRRIGSVLVVGDYQGQVHLIDIEDGSFAGRIATDGTAIVTAALPVPGGFIVQTRGGGVYAIGLAA
jgi:outer membrane protein assembly factor BamB